MWRYVRSPSVTVMADDESTTARRDAAKAAGNVQLAGLGVAARRRDRGDGALMPVLKQALRSRTARVCCSALLAAGAVATG